MSDRRDPTRSLGLRRHGRTLVNRRVYSLYQRLRQALNEQDVAGLRAVEPVHAIFVNWAESAAHKLERSEAMLQQVIGQSLSYPADWPRDLIERSVRHGIELVEQELRTSLGYLDQREVSRLHAVAAASEVRGIAGETQRRMLRHVVRALETKATPAELMREVRATIEKVTRLRLNLMVNTSVVRAVNAAKLFAYESEGIERVGIDPEWLPVVASRHADSVAGHCHHRGAGNGLAFLADVRTKKAKKRATRARNRAKRKQAPKRREPSDELKLVEVLTAGDDKVCQDCEDIAADGPYLLAQARDLIPAHPNCRCAFIPWGDARFAEIEREDEFE
jgi:hypothetical protein